MVKRIKYDEQESNQTFNGTFQYFTVYSRCRRKFQSAPKRIEIQYRALVNSQGKATKTVQIISVPSKTQRWPSVTETMRYEGQTQPRKEAGN